ncbi:hypothetical protein NX059_010317 [Plenodomus lindquistii]|nr:hypothetical protein NX059_010317 [Plenodomus lindquistii]
MERLPLELTMLITENLDKASICALSLTCKNGAEIGQDKLYGFVDLRPFNPITHGSTRIETQISQFLLTIRQRPDLAVKLWNSTPTFPSGVSAFVAYVAANLHKLLDIARSINTLVLLYGPDPRFKSDTDTRIDLREYTNLKHITIAEDIFLPKGLDNAPYLLPTQVLPRSLERISITHLKMHEDESHSSSRNYRIVSCLETLNRTDFPELKCVQIAHLNYFGNKYHLMDAFKASEAMQNLLAGDIELVFRDGPAD